MSSKFLNRERIVLLFWYKSISRSKLNNKLSKLSSQTVVNAKKRPPFVDNRTLLDYSLSKTETDSE